MGEMGMGVGEAVGGVGRGGGADRGSCLGRRGGDRRFGRGRRRPGSMGEGLS